MRSEAEIREALGLFALMLTGTQYAKKESHVLVAETLFECLTWVLAEEGGEKFGDLIQKFRIHFKELIESTLRSQRQ